MSLEKDQFTVALRVEHNGTNYDVVVPKGRPMVLFCKRTGTPIASVRLRCQSNQYQNKRQGNRGKALFTHRHSRDANFQGMVSMDNQEIELIITNLTLSGIIKIDILKKARKVLEVDPGPEGEGLNHVNELRRLQSYAIQCDQKDSGVLILQTIRKTSGKTLTVKEDEGMDQEEKQGSYYYISVVPERNNRVTEELFVDTVWKCVDFFVIRKAVNYPSYRLGSINRYPHRTNALCTPQFVPNNFHNVSDDEWTGLCVMNKQFAPMPSDYAPPPHNDMSGDGDETELTTECAPMDDIVDSSSAAIVKTGRHITVRSGYTGIRYNVDVHTNDPDRMCKFGLSVSDKIIFLNKPKIDDLRERGREVIKDMIENKSKELLASLDQIYEISDHCVICLEGKEENKPVNTVLCQCGHKVTHFECCQELTTCPICRGHISAKILVSETGEHLPPPMEDDKMEDGNESDDVSNDMLVEPFEENTGGWLGNIVSKVKKLF